MPTFNESRSGHLPSTLNALSKVTEAEVLLIDGGSTDDTLDIAHGYPCKVLELPNSTRAARLKLGMETARGDLIFLHHPRSRVDPSTLMSLKDFCTDGEPLWGGLTHQFDMRHWLLRFTSWYSNKVRFDRRGIVYLDHCIFFHRAFLELGLKIPDVPIFEDTELSKLLGKQSQPVRIQQLSVTSAIRFQQNGVFKQSLQNQLLKIGFYLGISNRKMNRYYEKGLNLNE